MGGSGRDEGPEGGIGFMERSDAHPVVADCEK